VAGALEVHDLLRGPLAEALLEPRLSNRSE
jgi:hypothetical protein